MSATPITVGATIRGSEALAEVRRLIDRLYLIDSDIASHDGPHHETYGLTFPFDMTHEEVADVLHRRRDDVLRQLENKGIRVVPDPEPVPAPKDVEPQEQRA